MKPADLVPCWGFIAGLLALSLAMGAAGLAQYGPTLRSRIVGLAMSVCLTISGAALIFGKLLAVILTR